MAGNIRGITIEIGGDTTKLEKALQKVNQTSRELNKELKDISKSMKFNPGNADLLTQKQRALSSAIENTKEKLKQLKDAQAQASKQLAEGKIGQDQYDALTREILKTENQLKSLEKELNSSQSSWQKLGQTLQDAGGKLQVVGDKITSIGKSLSAKLTAPIVAIGTASGKLAVDFESAMAGVAKTVDMTESEFEAMSQSIRDMAKEIPATTTEIAGVAEAAGQLGIEKENILAFTRTMIDLGESTNLTSDQAATAFARFANITQMPQDQFDKLGSAVVALGNNFATTEAEIVELGMRLAGTGTQVGLSQADIMGLATAMSSVGISAEAGGTAMSMVLNKMNNAIASSGSVMQDLGYVSDELGISVEQLVAQLSLGDKGFEKLSKQSGLTKETFKGLAKDYDDAVVPFEKFVAVAEKGGMAAEEFATKWQTAPSEVLEAFVAGLAKVQEEGGNVNLTLEELGITGVRETDTLNRLSGAAELLPEAFELANQAFGENTALSEEASKRYETMASQMEMAKNKLKDVGITIGQEIMPYVMEFVDWISKMANKFAELNPATQEMIVQFAAFLAALGPVAVVVGTVVGAIGKVTTVLGLLATSAALPVAAFAALSAGIIALAAVIYKNWDAIKAKTQEIWTAVANHVKSQVELSKQQVTNAWNAIKTATDTTFNAIKSVASTVWEAVKSTITNIVNNIKSTVENVWNTLKSSCQNTFNQIKTNIDNVWNGIKSATSSTWNSVKSTISNAIDGAKQAVSNAIERMKSILNIQLPFPKIKLPHFKVSGSFSLNPPSIPRFSVDWYDKGGIFTGPSIIGVGEKRPEFVGALDDLKAIVAEVIDKKGGATRGGDVVITGNTFNVRDDDDIKRIAQEIYRLQQREARGKGLVPA